MSTPSKLPGLLRQALASRVVVADGAMGTMLQQYNFSEEDYRGQRFKDYPSSLKGNNDLLSLTQPEAIDEIHRKYFEAGADIVDGAIDCLSNSTSQPAIGTLAALLGK